MNNFYNEMYWGLSPPQIAFMTKWRTFGVIFTITHVKPLKMTKLKRAYLLERIAGLEFQF